MGETGKAKIKTYDTGGKQHMVYIPKSSEETSIHSVNFYSTNYYFFLSLNESKQA